MTTATMPAWLAQQIEDRTGMAPGTRNARPTRCSSCKARTLTGLSDDVLAWTVEVDPAPITAVGEALAQLTGRRTYALRRHGGGRSVQLYPRDRWQITGSPAGLLVQHRPYDVVAEHACGRPLPTAQSNLRPRPRQEASGGPPPF